MNGIRLTASVVFVLYGLTLFAQSAHQVDPRAKELAEETLEHMGGTEEWRETRYLVWENFGQRHYWDKRTGDFRWERDSLTAILNIHSMEGRYWIDGQEVTDPEELAERLENVYARWVNNSYWFIMPYKLLDPGVNLRYMGEDTTATGQRADVLELTFDNVGLTPYNKYHVYIDKQSGLVSQWTHWRHRDDPEPRFTLPWTEWREYGGVMLSTGRGSDRADIKNVAVPDELPEGIFEGLVY